MYLRWLEGGLAMHRVSNQHQFLITIKIQEHVMGADSVDMFISKFLGGDDFPLDIEHQFVAQKSIQMRLIVPPQIEEFGNPVTTEASYRPEKINIRFGGKMYIFEVRQSIGKDGLVYS